MANFDMGYSYPTTRKAGEQMLTTWSTQLAVEYLRGINHLLRCAIDNLDGRPAPGVDPKRDLPGQIEGLEVAVNGQARQLELPRGGMQ